MAKLSLAGIPFARFDRATQWPDLSRGFEIKFECAQSRERSLNIDIDNVPKDPAAFRTFCDALAPLSEIKLFTIWGSCLVDDKNLGECVVSIKQTMEVMRRMASLEDLRIVLFSEQQIVELLHTLLSPNEYSQQDAPDGCIQSCLASQKMRLEWVQFPRPFSAGRMKLFSLLKQQRKLGLEPACRIGEINYARCSNVDIEIKTLLQELFCAGDLFDDDDSI